MAHSELTHLPLCPGSAESMVENLRFSDSELSDHEQLLTELQRLKVENEQLSRENHDLTVALSTISEHGDTVQAQLHAANVQLQAEIADRQRAEAQLQTLLALLTQERNDLEIIIQTLAEHGDTLDICWDQKLREAIRQANLDGLTQVANRRKFDHHLDEQWHKMAQSGLPLSIVLCDIDYFKRYNDTYGHLSGDRCLHQIAQALLETVYHPQDLVARYGGEEFAIVLPNTHEEGAVRVAQRIRATIAQMQIPHANSPVAPIVTVSIGVASGLPNVQLSPSMLVNTADRYLYLAKQRGRDRIVHRLAMPQE